MLNFPHKTPSNFYSNEAGFGLAESKGEGELWLEQLPHNSILVKPEYFSNAILCGYADIGSGLKDGDTYHVMILKKEDIQ